MNEWELTEEELGKLENGGGCSVSDFASPADVEWVIASAKAAQKKLYKWLLKPCYGHSQTTVDSVHSHYECIDCGRELREALQKV